MAKKAIDKIREWAQKSDFIVDVTYYPERDIFEVRTDGGRAVASSGSLDEAWESLKKPTESKPKKKRQRKKKEPEPTTA